MMGDPMLDLFQYGYMEDGVFHPTEDLQYAHWGGAANVVANIQAMRGKNTYVASYFRIPNVSPGEVFDPADAYEKGVTFRIKNSHYPVKYYQMDYQTRLPISVSDLAGSPLSSRDVAYNSCDGTIDKFDTKILVVSDYQKGFVERHLDAVKHKFDYCIIDSRYANTDFEYLRDISKTLIWRKTDSDKWGSFNWDWIVKTEGPNMTLICNQDMSFQESYPVEEKGRVVNTVGAGDTFTAALAVHIASTGSFDPKLACQYAHEACQEVIGMERTAIARRTKIK
jgi:bifunctional ADP-heptose synthase (sugar kinase/adenylyltransferase)